jgi:hypothetical protein
MSGAMSPGDHEPTSRILGAGRAGLRRHMRRRDFIMLVGSAVATLSPLAGRAQQIGVPRKVGFSFRVRWGRIESD